MPQLLCKSVPSVTMDCCSQNVLLFLKSGGALIRQAMFIISMILDTNGFFVFYDCSLLTSQRMRRRGSNWDFNSQLPGYSLTLCDQSSWMSSVVIISETVFSAFAGMSLSCNLWKEIFKKKCYRECAAGWLLALAGKNHWFWFHFMRTKSELSLILGIRKRTEPRTRFLVLFSCGTRIKISWLRKARMEEMPTEEIHNPILRTLWKTQQY